MWAVFRSLRRVLSRRDLPGRFGDLEPARVLVLEVGQAIRVIPGGQAASGATQITQMRFERTKISFALGPLRQPQMLALGRGLLQGLRDAVM